MLPSRMKLSVAFLCWSFMLKAVASGDVLTLPPVPPCPHSYKSFVSGVRAHLNQVNDRHFSRDIEEMLPRLKVSMDSMGMTASEADAFMKALIEAYKKPTLRFNITHSGLMRNFESFAARKPNLKGKLHFLTDVLGEAGKHGFLPEVFFTYVEGMDLGLSLEQTSHLMMKSFVTGEKTASAAEVHYSLSELLKQMRIYGVDPEFAYASADRLLDSDRAYFIVDMVTGLIERSVLQKGHSANEIPRMVLVAGSGSNSLENRLEKLELKYQGHGSPLATAHSNDAAQAALQANHPQFPLVQGSLRHSEHTYMIQKGYEAGLDDLRRLALDRRHLDEGAFIFSADSNTWFSLGGKTRHDESNLLTQTLVHRFDVPKDLSAFGQHLSFVHIHPEGAEFMLRLNPDKLVRPEFAELLESFALINPSRADMRMGMKLLQRASKPVNLDVVVVHRLGHTTARIKKGTLETSALADNFLKLKDSVLTDPKLDFDEIARVPTLNGQIQYLQNRLRPLISDGFDLDFVPAAPTVGP